MKGVIETVFAGAEIDVTVWRAARSYTGGTGEAMSRFLTRALVKALPKAQRSGVSPESLKLRPIAEKGVR